MTTLAPTHTSEQLLERIFNASVATFDIYTMYLGERLGLYRALAANGSLSPEGLAEATGTDTRYVREWLEQQATSGIIEHDAGRFSLPAEYAAVLVNRDDPNYFVPIVRMITAAGAILPKLLQAFGTGDGIDWSEYGPDMVEAQSEVNRPFFLHQLAPEILPSIPEIHAKLSRPGARVAEIGAGGGWASIAIARQYEGVTVEGYDLDEGSVTMARANVRDAGLAERVRFHHRDAADAASGETFDLVAAFECVHDMSNPVAVLRTMKSLAGSDGKVLIVDERTAEAFDPAAGDVERYLYGFSVTTCLPNGRVDWPSAATGTVLRPATMERYALDAGFSSVEVLPIENEFFRFYLLRQ